MTLANAAVVVSEQTTLNLSVAELVEHAIRRSEARFAEGGALVAETGEHTGRSPKDKFIVRDETTQDHVWWDNNAAMSPEHFSVLSSDFNDHLANLPSHYSQDLFAGANPDLRIGVTIKTELAWHSLFIRNLLIRLQPNERTDFKTDLTIISLPSFKANPERHGCRTETVIACNFAQKIILIGGTAYAGEIKKAVFTYLNYIYPEKGILPMHCSANVGVAGDVALFFGLSGTGKTTLSADQDRSLIGDDEHGWSKSGVFNFEGGCYAKTINLTETNEPEIFSAARRFGTVLENVVIDKTTRSSDFNDGSKTENTRAAYSLDAISNATKSGMATHPSTIIMLTCDAFGVLPPIARLTPQQAIDFFIVGYTAKIAGTERGVTEPQVTFSTCFGAPFMPRKPRIYGKLLQQYIASHNTSCWLINTGWTGGPYGVGNRFPLSLTRKILTHVLNSSLGAVEYYYDEFFGFEVPISIAGFDSAIFRPQLGWQNQEDYSRAALELRSKFHMELARLS